MTLEGKTALITGATAGIGAATARLFAERGAKLILTGRNAAAGEALAAELGAVFVAADITASGSPARLMAAVAAQNLKLDVLVNNAGILFHGDSQACTDAQWDELMAVNVSAVFRMSRAAVAVMAAQQGGCNR